MEIQLLLSARQQSENTKFTLRCSQTASHTQPDTGAHATTEFGIGSRIIETISVLMHLFYASNTKKNFSNLLHSESFHVNRSNREKKEKKSIAFY